MVEIISKRDGPRRQDAEVRRLIEQNRATITRIADHISGGGYSASKAPKKQKQADGLIIHVGSGPRPPTEAKPKIRVSPNGRVVAVDNDTGRQLHHIGEFRHRDGIDVFVLATKPNGFFSPVDGAIAAALRDLDGAPLRSEYSEDELAADICTKLGWD